MPPEIKKLNWQDIADIARHLADEIIKTVPTSKEYILFGISSGGYHAAQAVRAALLQRNKVTHITDAEVFANILVDDIVASGDTKKFWTTRHPNKPFFTLVDKTGKTPATWIQFPWETKNNAGAEMNVTRIIQYIGEDPKREGLLETPRRVAKSWEKIFGGYKYKDEDVEQLLKTFKDGACDELVVLSGIEMYSVCEHHMQPFVGTAAIGYLPNGRVVGVSKLARLLEVFSRRLQIQERIGQQVTEALCKHLQPKGAACLIQAKHFCMMCRGVEKQNSVMTTSSMVGAFRDDAATRAEFMAIVNSAR